MKSVLLSLSLILLLALQVSAAKTIDANPINIAATLVEKADSAKVASSLEYYGYSPQGTENGYQIMRNSAGTEIRFTFNDNGTPTKHPIIVVNAPASKKTLESTLQELNFRKSGQVYEKAKNQYSSYVTKCSHGSNNTLIFSRPKR